MRITVKDGQDSAFSHRIHWVQAVSPHQSVQYMLLVCSAVQLLPFNSPPEIHHHLPVILDVVLIAPDHKVTN